MSNKFGGAVPISYMDGDDGYFYCPVPVFALRGLIREILLTHSHRKYDLYVDKALYKYTYN